MSEHWHVAAGDKSYVSIPGVVKPIACGSQERARLIAAAPEMLEQCKLFEQTIEYYIKLDMAHDDEESANLKRYSLHELRAVIAKAEGRET